MTSELKLCKFCGSEMKNCGAPIWEDYCENKECTPLYQKEFFNSLKKSTRAVPDVPELVRLHIDSEGVQECKDGEYVRHDQAAAVIAAKDGRITDYKNLVDALHAKLAQYEAQEPVGYVTDRVKTRDGGHCFMSLHQAAPYINPVYASPLAPDGGGT